MKIKQTTKMIILVVALVSVIGVGAVSYAAWTGGVPSITASASVGQVELIGFSDNSALTLSSGKKLVPYDQDGTGSDSNNVKMVSGVLPAYVVSGNYTITASVNTEVGDNVAAKCYYKIVAGTEEVTVPTAGALNGWTKVGDAIPFTSSALYDGATVSGMTIYVILDSDALTDMNATVGLTLTLAAANA